MRAAWNGQFVYSSRKTDLSAGAHDATGAPRLTAKAFQTALPLKALKQPLPVRARNATLSDEASAFEHARRVCTLTALQSEERSGLVRDLEPEQIHTEDAPRVAPAEAETARESSLAPRVAASGGDRLGPAHVASLQRMAGNAAVAQLLRRGDEDEDEHEHEHDGINHEEAPGASVHNLLESDAGQPLEGSMRERMEPAFGHGFGDVRVHSGEAAAVSAQRMSAQAYTVGNDIVLGAGHPDLSSEAGERVLAHELTHVVQQSNGPVDGADAGGGVAVSDPGDRFEREAEHTAEAVMSGQPASVGGKEAAGSQQMSVQRMEEEGGEEEGSEGEE